MAILTGCCAHNAQQPDDFVANVERVIIGDETSRGDGEKCVYPESSSVMTNVLQRWNGMSEEEAAQAVLPCCGSRAWASTLAATRPLMDEAALLAASDRAWWSLTESDWDAAFQSHPRIGEKKAVGSATATSLAWSKGEQASASDLKDADVAAHLAEGNRAYEQKFGRIYIVCATGKSAREMLVILQTRMQNDAATEAREAAEQQRQITHLRLQKWLRGE